MAVCKSCQIDLSKKPKKEYKFPSDIPLSKDMVSTVNKLRSDTNGRKHKGNSKRR